LSVEADAACLSNRVPFSDEEQARLDALEAES
jgi:hypothetical protein